jgi:Holliday junction resolvasome RuvABC endonuclease subunit
MVYFAGIDPGNSLGWSVLDSEGKRKESGVWWLGKISGEGKGLKFIRFEEYLRNLIDKYGSKNLIIGYEDIQPFGSGAQKMNYYGIVTRLFSVCDSLGISYHGVKPATHKRVATGRGNANKDASVEAARLMFFTGVNKELTHDEADALWVAYCTRLDDLREV